MKNGATRDVPSWAIAAALTATLLIAVYFGVNVVTGRAADPAPPKKVYPGMYDLRAEARKARQSASVAGTENGR